MPSSVLTFFLIFRHFTGSIYAYDNNFEKARMKLSGTVLKADAPKPVDPPIMNDAYINEISSKFPDEFVVFTSDKVLSTLMCSISSVHPWDILIERKGNVLYLDKRPRGPIDVINVNETGSDVLLAEGNDVNTPNTSAFLSKEAAQYTRLVQYLSQDKGVCVKFSEPASAKVPAADKEKESGDALKDVKFPSGHCYRYRKWSLGEGMSLVCRLKIDLIKDLPNNSATPKEEYLSSDDVEHISGALSFQNIKVLNECDPKASNLPNPPQGWIKTLEANCGTVFANEVKNNNNKISRWTIESILGGVDMIRFAFVSRLNPKLITFPILLLVSSFPPRYIFDSMHFPSQESCWGIVKTFADHLRANIRDGSYFLIKDPNKAALKLFQCSVSNINEADEDANISITVQDESAL